MKLTILLLTVVFFNVHATGVSQNITLAGKNISFKEVVAAIKEQTGHLVFCKKELAERTRPVTLNVRDISLTGFLELVLRNQALTFRIDGKTIFISAVPARVVPPNDLALPELVSNPLPITGRITDAAGKPLSGVSVVIKGTRSGTTTNEKGIFTLNAEVGQVFIISSIQFESKELVITSALATSTEKPLDIILNAAFASLHEVEINAGYYTVKEKERTGAISRVTAETIGKQPVSNPLLALQGSATGIFIQQTSGNPGSNVNVIIRGKNSIAAGNNPFYVIDGVPFISESLSSSLSSGVMYNGGSSPLNILNPGDIESIEVLKDADATAIYGSRGANGVILITTKKGKAGKTIINANLQSGFSNVSSRLKMMNTAQYLEMRKEGFKNDGIAPNATNYDVNGTWDPNRNTNWQKELMGGTAHYNNAQLSISGGNASTQLLISGNYQVQTNVYRGDHSYRKFSVNFSGSHTALDGKFKANFIINYLLDKNDQIYADFTGRAISFWAPNAPELYTADGKLNWANSTWTNPLNEWETQFLAKNNALIGNFTLSYQLTKSLNIKANVGYNDNRLNDFSCKPSSYYDPAQNVNSSKSFADHNDNKVNSWIAEPQLTYEKRIGKGKLSFLSGLTFQSQKKEQLVIRALGYASDALIKNIKAAVDISIRDFKDIGYKYQAAYARLNYNLQNKYIFNLTGRRDGSTRFGPGKQFANFGAVGLAWIFSDEDFVRDNQGFMSFGKLRASYGITGNDQIGDYEFMDVFDPTTAYHGVSGLVPARLFNPDLAWEVNKKFELGLDLNFANDRLLVSLDYYLNRSSNQLVYYTLAATTGFGGIRSNLGATVQNTGLEAELKFSAVKTKTVSWETAFNISMPKNKLIAFPGLENSSYNSDYMIGRSLNLRRLYKDIGVNPQTGLWEVEDMNKDGKISVDDKMVLADRTQHFFGGLRNTVVYKNFELGFLLYFLNQTKGNYFSYALVAPGKNNHNPRILENRWQKPGDKADIQRFTTGADAAAKTAYSRFTGSDAVIRKSSFVSLKNIDISYTIKSIKGMNLRIYAQGQNLFKITNFFGLDPEIDGFVMPPLRTFIVGTSLIF